MRPGHEPPRRPWLDPPELMRALDRQYALGLACMAALVLAFPAYWWGEPGRRATRVRAQASFDVEQGRALFALYCAGCHGEGARGGRGFPTLAAREFLASASDRQVEWIVSSGIPGTPMPTWHLELGGPLSEQQIRQVVRYLRTLERGAPSVPRWREGVAAPAPSPRRDHRS